MNNNKDEFVEVKSSFIDELQEDIVKRDRIIEEKDVRIDYLTRLLYAPKSEKSKAEDIPSSTLLGTDVEFVVDEEDAKKKKDTLADRREKGKAKKKRNGKNGGGRKKISKELPIKEVILELPEGDAFDSEGNPIVVIGNNVSERLYFSPAKWYRLVVVQRKYGYADSKEYVKSAEPYRQMIPGGKLADETIHEIIYNKYALSLPFYRQIEDFNMCGADLNSSICSDMSKAFSEKISSFVANSILNEIKSSKFIHIDETTMSELDTSKNKTKYIWTFHSGHNTYYHYGSRGSKELETVLGATCKIESESTSEYSGIMITDGYSSYDTHKSNTPEIKKGACMAHARRKFNELPNGTPHKTEALNFFRQLYKTEKEAKKHCEKEKGQINKANHYYNERQNKSTVILEKLKTLLGTPDPNTDEASYLTKAKNYMLNRWEEFELYLTDGELPIDNNAAERQIKRVVIGRKNYLFVGSEDAGEWAAITTP